MIYTILQLFVQTILIIQGDIISLDRILFIINILIKVFEKALVNIIYILIYILIINLYNRRYI